MNDVLKRIGMRMMPGVTGLIERRILVTVRIKSESAARIIPKPLRPKVVDGWNVAGVSLIRLRDMRPQGLPDWLGQSSENAAHRFAVQWLENGKVCEGVYIPARDTDSQANHLIGGRLFPGVHHLAQFKVWESEARFRVGYDRTAGGCSVKVVARWLRIGLWGHYGLHSTRHRSFIKQGVWAGRMPAAIAAWTGWNSPVAVGKWSRSWLSDLSRATSRIVNCFRLDRWNSTVPV